MNKQIQLNNAIIAELRNLEYTIGYKGELKDLKQFSCVEMSTIVKRISELELENKRLKYFEDEN